MIFEVAKLSVFFLTCHFSCVSSLSLFSQHSPMNEDRRVLEVGDASAYYAPGAIPKVDALDEETTALLQEIYVESGRYCVLCTES